MKDSQIRAYIAHLQNARNEIDASVSPSVKQLDERIELSQHELTARSSNRLARVSIVISTIAIVASAASIIA